MNELKPGNRTSGKRFSTHAADRSVAASGRRAAQPRALLTERQVEIVDALKRHCPGFTTMQRLTLSFRTILRVGKVPTLHRWMANATATEINVLQRFVQKLRQDLEAVEGAVTERWSNGPSKGTSTV
jgi:transposase